MTSPVSSAEHDADEPWSSFVRALSVIGLVLAGPACTVGPDFVKPKVSLNARWNESNDPRLAANTATDVAWWKTFADPMLDRLIELAYHQNISLQIAGARILEARAQLGIAQWDRFPQRAGVSGSATAVGLSKHSSTGALVDRHYGDFEIGFDALWEVDFWGKYRKGVRAAHATYLATVADYDDALVALSAEVARTYVVIRTFQVLVDQARQNEGLQKEGFDIAEARFRNGATSELDVTQARNLLETTRASIPELQASLVQAQSAFSTLLGRPTGYIQTLMGDGPHVIPSPPASVAVSVPAEMLRRRPDIRAAELRAMAQCDRIGIAKAELLPKFTLFGLIGTETTVGAGTLANSSGLGDLFGPGSLAYNAGASLFWPIFNYGRIQNNVRVEDARFQQTLLEYVDVVLRAAQEVEDGITGYLRNQDATVFAQNAVVAAEQSVKLALVQYREGAVDFQRVLDTERALLDSQNRLANTQSAVATNLIALYKALGGGWELRAFDPVVSPVTQHEMQQRTNWGGYFAPPQEPRPNPAGAAPGK